MFKQKDIERLPVRDLGDGFKLVVSLRGIEADLEEDWGEHRFFIKPDMFTFQSCIVSVERDGKEINIINADADNRPKGYNFFRADKFFDAWGDGSIIWNAIEDYVNEASNDGDFDWEAEAAERQADMRLHMMREEGL